MSNPYLEGGLAPIQHEYTLTDLPVSGTIPDYLDGRYLRNGPNPVGEIDPAVYHWFIGDGMVHGVRLRDGKAEWYRNRYVRGPQTAAALGEQPPRGRRFGASGIGANTNVIGHAGRTLALIEGGLSCYELTEELDTVGVCDFDGTLPGGYSAHPKRDSKTGELHAVSYAFNRGNSVQYSVVGTDGRARRTVDIEVTGSPMMHDFSLTEKHVVFYDLPVTFDARQVAEGTAPPGLRLATRLILNALIGRVHIPDPITARLPTGPASARRMPYRWDPKYPARVGVMPRDGGNADVRWFDVEPCYVFHPMNAYDDGAGSGEALVLDVVRHPKMFDTDLRGPNEGPPTLDRWIVDLADGKVRESRLDDRSQEFPRIDERLLGKRHRFGYSVGVREMTSDSVLLKHDLVGATTATRAFGAGKQLGEFVFQHAPGGAGEDDGVLMGFVYDAAADRSDLAILDAQTLDDVARIHLPHRVPAGFHGNWVPTGQ